MFKQIKVTWKEKSPILMNRFPLEPIEAMEKKTKEEQAEIASYRHPETGELYIPAVNIQRALINGATYVKGKGRASMQKPAAACLIVTPEYILLGTKEYTIDSRAVVNPTTHGRFIRHRPRLDKWEITFFIEYDDVLISGKQLRDIVDNTCMRVGILDFRPEKKGPFGRSMVTLWEEVKF